jgi:hypothetical protein
MGRSANPSNTEKDKDKNKAKAAAPVKSSSDKSSKSSDVVERSGGLGGGKGAERNAARYEKTSPENRLKSNTNRSYGYYDDSLKTYVPARIDRINGGGRNQSGAEFEGGGLYSALLNLVGVNPYGSQRERPYGGNYQAPAIAQAMPNASQNGGAARPAAAAVPPQQAGPADFYGLQGNPAMNGQMPMGSYNATDMNLGSGMQPAGAQQSSPMDFYNLQGNPAMQAPQSSLQSSFAPYVPPAGTNVVTAGAMSPSTTGAGALGSVPIPDYGMPTQAAPQIDPNTPNTPPKNMSELRYLSWLRNQGGAINVDKMSPEGLRIMYQNYQNSPMF